MISQGKDQFIKFWSLTQKYKHNQATSLLLEELCNIDSEKTKLLYQFKNSCFTFCKMSILKECSISNLKSSSLLSKAFKLWDKLKAKAAKQAKLKLAHLQAYALTLFYRSFKQGLKMFFII